MIILNCKMQITSIDFSSSTGAIHDLGGLPLATGRGILHHQSIHYRNVCIRVHPHHNCLHNRKMGGHMSPNEIPEVVQFITSCQRDRSDLDSVHFVCPALPHSHTDVLRDDTPRDVSSPPRLHGLQHPPSMAGNHESVPAVFLVHIFCLTHDSYNTYIHSDWDNAV